MWYDELPADRSWASLWSGYIICGECPAIRHAYQSCPVCGDPADGDNPLEVTGSNTPTNIDESPDSQLVSISVDNRFLLLRHKCVTGAAIKAAANANGMRNSRSHLLLETRADGTSHAVADEESILLSEDSRFVTVAPVAMGAEGRYEDWLYLGMLEREWKRPVTESDRLPESGAGGHPSARAAIVVLFWSYFETRIERLLRAAIRTVPPRLMEDAFQRYSSIGSRLDRFYRVLFKTTYWADLADLGYEDIRRHLSLVKDRRNAFAHGDPRAIDDALVAAVVGNLRREHEAWIAVYNRRGAAG